MPPRPYNVIEDWTRSYDSPLVVISGQQVEVGVRDSDWPGFLWCRGADGKEAWLPEVILAVTGETATALRDYDPIELTAAAGDRVFGDEALAGWIWCRNQAGAEGWLPARLLEAHNG